MKIRLLMGCVIGILCMMSQINAQTDFSEITSIQKEIISRLSGEEAIESNVFLKQRASGYERKVTVRYLSNYLSKLGWEVENHHYKVPNENFFVDLLVRPVKGVNVVGLLKSTVPSDSYVILGAHYDSERGSPGAIDNASGIALGIVIAQKLKELKKRKVNFIIAFFDQEEDNEVGSRAYAKKIKKEKMNVHSVHIVDLIGWDTDQNRKVVLQSPTSYLEKLYNNQAKLLGIPVRVIGGGASDNLSFLKTGYNTVGVFEDIDDSTPHLHQPTDTYATVNFDYLNSSTQLVYNVLKTIAQ